jgi:uncharacterized membrane protein
VSRSVDVTTAIEIGCARSRVAAFASNPDNAPAWYENIKSVEWQTERPVGVGSRFAFVAQFLGRRLAYVYEVTESVNDQRFVMVTTDGPFAMETTYTWEDVEGGCTRMTLRNRGERSGFSIFVAPFLAAAMRRANRKDLARLKRIVEIDGDMGAV